MMKKIILTFAAALLIFSGVLPGKEWDGRELPGPKISGGKVVKQVLPEYPADALRKGISGRVMLWVTYNRGGRVTAVKVLRPERADEALNTAAREAAFAWRFTPLIMEETGEPLSSMDGYFEVWFDAKKDTVKATRM